MILTLLIIGAGCKPTPSPAGTLPPYPGYEAYPAYPTHPPPKNTVVASGYPGPAASTPVGAVQFQFDRPVKVGDTVVKGIGPAGVPIVIASVTEMGLILGEGVIEQDNRFAIPVAPLKPVRIGLVVKDEPGETALLEKYSHPAYFGAGALTQPQIGFFFDTVMVRP